jgi:hypothetical protein
MLRSRALQEYVKQIREDMYRAKEVAIQKMSTEDLEVLSGLLPGKKPTLTPQAALNRFWVAFWTEYGEWNK